MSFSGKSFIKMQMKAVTLKPALKRQRNWPSSNPESWRDTGQDQNSGKNIREHCTVNTLPLENTGAENSHLQGNPRTQL